MPPTSREPITVLIPTYNEERNLPDALASLAGWADEIFVVDSFSTDRTIAIANAAGARVVQHAYVNSAAQKNWAIPQCTHRWVLVLDADERVTPELAREIQALLRDQATRTAAAYGIYRRTFFLDIPITRCGWARDRVVRLFDRARARYPELEVHADLVADGPIADLGGRIDHYTYRTLDEYFEKFRRYTTWSANDLWKRGTRCGLGALAFRPIGRFLTMYVLRRGFLDGAPGFMVCALSAFSVLGRYAKLWAMQRAHATGARYGDGRRVIHAGAAVQEEPEIIGGSDGKS
ncbi:MAG: glycosyltransferase family 2 protein [Planctomycetes bacterium]|nr:glycosyltransferase family 2 protein [Planctomycetota bacterium]